MSALANNDKILDGVGLFATSVSSHTKQADLSQWIPNTQSSPGSYVYIADTGEVYLTLTQGSTVRVHRRPRLLLFIEFALQLSPQSTYSTAGVKVKMAQSVLNLETVLCRIAGVNESNVHVVSVQPQSTAALHYRHYEVLVRTELLMNFGTSTTSDLYEEQDYNRYQINLAEKEHLMQLQPYNLLAAKIHQQLPSFYESFANAINAKRLNSNKIEEISLPPMEIVSLKTIQPQAKYISDNKNITNDGDIPIDAALSFGQPRLDSSLSRIFVLPKEYLLAVPEDSPIRTGTHLSEGGIIQFHSSGSNVASDPLYEPDGSRRGIKMAVEENHGQIVLTLTRTKGLFGSVTIQYEIGSCNDDVMEMSTTDAACAHLGQDFILSDTQVMFNTGEDKSYLPITVIDNLIATSKPRVFRLVISACLGIGKNLRCGDPEHAAPVAQVTILDNDEWPYLSFNQSFRGVHSLREPYMVEEYNRPEAAMYTRKKIAVVRTGNMHGHVAIVIQTVDHSTIVNKDYTIEVDVEAPSSSACDTFLPASLPHSQRAPERSFALLCFPPFHRVQYFVLAALPDWNNSPDDENDMESFEINMEHPVGCKTSSRTSDTKLVVHIANTQQEKSVIEFVKVKLAPVEEPPWPDTGRTPVVPSIVLLTLTRTGELLISSEVELKIHGMTAAVEDGDVAALPARVQFRPSETCQYVNVSVLRDFHSEEEEIFMVGISKPSSGTVLGYQTGITIRIHDTFDNSPGVGEDSLCVDVSMQIYTESVTLSEGECITGRDAVYSSFEYSNKNVFANQDSEPQPLLHHITSLIAAIIQLDTVDNKRLQNRYIFVNKICKSQLNYDLDIFGRKKYRTDVTIRVVSPVVDSNNNEPLVMSLLLNHSLDSIGRNSTSNSTFDNRTTHVGLMTRMGWLQDVISDPVVLHRRYPSYSNVTKVVVFSFPLRTQYWTQKQLMGFHGIIKLAENEHGNGDVSKGDDEKNFDNKSDGAVGEWFAIPMGAAFLIVAVIFFCMCILLSARIFVFGVRVGPDPQQLQHKYTQDELEMGGAKLPHPHLRYKYSYEDQHGHGTSKASARRGMMARFLRQSAGSSNRIPVPVGVCHIEDVETTAAIRQTMLKRKEEKRMKEADHIFNLVRDNCNNKIALSSEIEQKCADDSRKNAPLPSPSPLSLEQKETDSSRASSVSSNKLILPPLANLEQISTPSPQSPVKFAPLNNEPMVRCNLPRCWKPATYNLPRAKPACRCHDHKTDDMVLTALLLCEHEGGCKAYAAFNFLGLTEKFCKEHANFGMVDVVTGSSQFQ